MFVMRVFPLRTDAFLEEMIVGLQGQFGCWGNVVLENMIIALVRVLN